MPLHIGITAAEQSVAQGVDCYCLVSGTKTTQTSILSDFIRGYLAQSRFALLESLAGHLAKALMSTFEISGVAIRLTKHPYDMTDIEGAGVLFSMGDHPIDPSEGTTTPWSHVFLDGLTAQHSSSHRLSIRLVFFVDILNILKTDDIACTIDYATLAEDIRCFVRALPANEIKHIAPQLICYLESILEGQPMPVCQITAITANDVRS